MESPSAPDAGITLLPGGARLNGTAVRIEDSHPAEPPLAAIAGAFALPSPPEAITPLGSGNVNDTFLVRCQSGDCFVLQRINTAVFRQPQQVMANIAALADHAGQRNWPQPEAPRRWELPQLLPCRQSGRPWLERGDEVWRLLTYVDGSISHDTVQSPEQAAEVGRALGGFHRLIHDLPCERLHDTLQGFHVTPGYLAAYDRLRAEQQPVATDNLRGADEAHCHTFIAARRRLAGTLERARERGLLQLRPIHGDPKVNNVLFDRASGRAVALVDLDTVKPGLVHYDIGDCLRSGCNPAGEETTDLETVQFDLQLARPMLQGYLELAGPFLSDADLDHIPVAAQLISFELGLRFFSDHLAGNRYFKCRHPHHNLDRALVQFRLTASIEQQLEPLRQLVAELR